MSSSSSSSSRKRKHTVLTFQRKLEILEKLDQGTVSARKLAEEYGIGKSTISDIKKNADSIQRYVSKLKVDCSQVKSRKTAHNVDLDEEIYKWYVEARETGVILTDSMICAKAIEMNTLLNGKKNFKASGGWLRHFKQRNGIFVLKYCKDESLSVETLELRKLTQKVSLKSVFVVNVASINWKALPKSKSVSEKHQRQRLLCVTCTNASGSKKLPLTLITPTRKKNIPCKTKKSVKDWFKAVFLPEMSTEKRDVVLVCDKNSLGQLQDVNSGGDGKVTLFAMTSTGCISREVKRNYKKKLLEVLVESRSDLASFQANLTLNQSVAMIVATWSELDEKTVEKSFLNLLNSPVIFHNHDEEVQKLARKVPELCECSLGDVAEWFEIDSKFQEEEHDDDDDEEEEEEEEEEEVLTRVVKSEEVKLEEESAEEEEIEEITEFSPSHQEAYHCLERVIEWYENQAERTSTSKNLLEKLRNLARKKMKVNNMNCSSDDSSS